jgi:cell division protein FtsL
LWQTLQKWQETLAANRQNCGQQKRYKVEFRIWNLEYKKIQIQNSSFHIPRKGGLMRDLTLAIPIGFIKRKTKTTASTYRLNLAILASTVLLGLVYLSVINSLGTKGYEIKKLDGQVRLLQDDQKNLQLQASDLQSINRIESEAQKLNFVPNNNVTYLKDSDFALK